MKELLNQAKPHLIAIVVGYILTIVFFSPLIFENKTLNQNDVFQGVGAGQEIIDYRKETGEQALWTNSMFSGMPAYLINMTFSGDLIKHVQRVVSLGLPSSAQVTFLGFVCFYILLISFGVRPILAFIGAFAYGFNTFNIISIEAGHIWKVRAIAYMPLVLAGVHMVMTHKRKLLSLAILSLAVALEIQANHLQITYYLFLTLIIYGIGQLFLTVKNGNWPEFGKNIGILVIAALIGVGANAGRLWTTIEYSKYSTRSKSELTPQPGQNSGSGLDRDYVFNWSYGIQESFTLLIPNFSGGASQQSLDSDSNLGTALRQNGLGAAQVRDQLRAVPTYWGQQPIVAGPTYVGAIICFLFILGILTADKVTRNWILVACGLSLLLAWGKNLEWFNYFMYDYFPGYNKFRSVSMTMTILLLCAPLLAMVGLERFLSEGNKKETNKKLLIAAGVTGGLSLIFILIAGTFSFVGSVDVQLANVPDWFKFALRADRESMLRSDAFRSLVLILISAAAIWAWITEKLKPSFAVIILAVLVLFDFWVVDKRFLNEENYQRKARDSFFSASPADQAIMNGASEHYRVLNLLNPFNEAKTSTHHSSLGGYHGAKMKRYKELIDYCLSGSVSGIIGQLQSGNTDLSAFTVVNMLNTEYLKFGDQQNAVIRNDQAFGNAWFVTNLKKVESADDEISSTCNLTSRTEAVINTNKFTVANSSYEGSGSISLREYSPNKLTYDVSTNSNAFAVFSEIYYPAGWIATIDGVEVEIRQVNYVLRGLEIPANAKEVIFEFKPNSYYVGNIFSLVFSIITLALLAGSVVLNFRAPSSQD